MITRDYIMRMLKQLAEGLARIAKQRQEAQYEEARDEWGDLCEDLLGHQPRMLEMLDARNAVRMLSAWHKVRIYSALCRAEAEILEAEGDAAGAARLDRRALEVFLEGVDRGGRGDPELRDTLADLSAKVELATLSPAYRQLIRKLAP